MLTQQKYIFVNIYEGFTIFFIFIKHLMIIDYKH